MARIIVHQDGRFVDWSMTLGRPASPVMDRRAMTEHLLARGHNRDVVEARLDRAAELGTSASDIRKPDYSLSAAAALADNQLGPGNSTLSADEVLHALFGERPAFP